MRSFFKIFFATLLALIAFVAVIIFFSIGLISGMVSSEKGEKKMAKHSVVVVDLSKPVYEQPFFDPLTALLKRNELKTQGLNRMLRNIENAKTDGRIDAIYLKLTGNANGWATNEALRRSLKDFTESGKSIIAYGDVISQSDYYLASVADKIYLNPEGSMDFRGLSATVVFFKEAMDNLDIKANIFYNGKFKSATEPFRRSDMSEPSKEQTRAYLNSIYGHFLSQISESRKIDSSQLLEIANKALANSAEDALSYGLVDGLKYVDEVYEVIKKKTDQREEEKINFVSLEETDTQKAGVGNKEKIAILYAQGNIVDEASGNSSEPEIAASKYGPLWKEIRENEEIKGVLFRVNSPGGSALASDEIWREIMLTKQVKPVVVSMGDYAASGGYYISCAADSIFTEPTTLTGSIGVFGIIPDLHGFFNNKLGVTFDGVKTTEYADMGSVVRPMTEGEKNLVQKEVDRIYTTFKKRVSKGRKINAEVVDSIAQGRVWTGSMAVRLGLADQLGGMEKALQSLKYMTGIEQPVLVEYPQKSGSYADLFTDLTDNMETRILHKKLGENYKVFETIKTLTSPDQGIMAKLPMDISIR